MVLLFLVVRVSGELPHSKGIFIGNINLGLMVASGCEWFSCGCFR
jgi:hypothetical protein